MPATLEPWLLKVMILSVNVAVPLIPAMATVVELFITEKKGARPVMLAVSATAVNVIAAFVNDVPPKLPEPTAVSV
jgi:hypothetical protein